MKAFATKPATQHPAPSQRELMRAVASSTAIETGESMRATEQKLQSGHRRFKNLRLA